MTDITSIIRKRPSEFTADLYGIRVLTDDHRTGTLKPSTIKDIVKHVYDDAWDAGSSAQRRQIETFINQKTKPLHDRIAELEQQLSASVPKSVAEQDRHDAYNHALMRAARTVAGDRIITEASEAITNLSPLSPKYMSKTAWLAIRKVTPEPFDLDEQDPI